ncbi:MAG TPA: hypothetical protein VF175_07565 [Lacipirellula sp.]
MNRSANALIALLFLSAELAGPLALVRGETKAAVQPEELELFDAMQSGEVEATFVARNSKQGNIVLKNKTNKPLSVRIPDAFIGVPLAQFGGGGMGGGGFGGGGGGQQSVGGGGGGRGGRGGGGRGGRGGGGFNIQPEKIVRVPVPLLCMDHGLEEPNSANPYAIRPIENYVKDPAVIEIIARYGAGELPTGAAQAAVWHANSGVSWNELASKLTGTKRNRNRAPYFSGDEIRGAMAIVAHARQLTAGEEVEPRPFKLPGEQDAAQEDPGKIVSPGEIESPGEESAEKPEVKPEAVEPVEAETEAA